MIAIIGTTALWLVYLWLLSAIVASYLAERKGYNEKLGLAFGLLLSVLGPIIWLFWPAIGLLPSRIREAYGFPWGLRQRAVATWLVATWQAWRPALPPEFRQMPQALRADQRVGAGSSGGLLEA